MSFTACLTAILISYLSGLKAENVIKEEVIVALNKLYVFHLNHKEHKFANIHIHMCGVNARG